MDDKWGGRGQKLTSVATIELRVYIPLFYFSLFYRYEEKRAKLVYNPAEHRFTVKNSSVFKFRYENDQSDSQKPTNSATSYLSRRRRHVFGKDNRFHVTNPYVEDFPFQSVVRLANGCTGTLIWYKHVLTSAHCVHDRKKFNPPVNQLKVSSGSFFILYFNTRKSILTFFLFQSRLNLVSIVIFGEWVKFRPTFFGPTKEVGLFSER